MALTVVGKALSPLLLLERVQETIPGAKGKASNLVISCNQRGLIANGAQILLWQALSPCK
jgi:hypothetical protein